MLAAPAAAGAAPRAAERLPAATAATPRAKAPGPLTLAAAAGRRHWGTVGCQGQVRIVAQAALAPGLHPDTGAWVTFGTPLGANDLAAAPSTYTGCTVSFARWRWPTSASLREDWELVCTTMVHELGHLLGRVHDDAPGDVMASVFTDRSRTPAACRTPRPAPATRSRR